MKRSLAKKSLEAALDLYMSNEVGALDSSILAEIALTHMESVVGMRPPTITVMKNTYNRADGTYGFDANEWEPEDE